jgi:hypothetical protein
MNDRADVKSEAPRWRYDRLKLAVALVGALSVGPPQAPCESVNVGIDGKHLCAERVHHHATGNLVGHAGKCRQIGQLLVRRPAVEPRKRDFAEVVPDVPQRRAELSSLHSGETGRSDDSPNGRNRSVEEIRPPREALFQSRVRAVCDGRRGFVADNDVDEIVERVLRVAEAISATNRSELSTNGEHGGSVGHGRTGDGHSLTFCRLDAVHAMEKAKEADGRPDSD